MKFLGLGVSTESGRNLAHVPRLELLRLSASIFPVKLHVSGSGYSGFLNSISRKPYFPLTTVC